MEITNLSPSIKTDLPVKSEKLVSVPILLIILSLAVAGGFFVSRLKPSTTQESRSLSQSTETTANTPPETAEKIEVGKIYGNLEKNFKDTATGILEKGSINGEGTHILNRPGGKSQRASLTSSALDLDLFVGKNVEVKGETNSSTKTSWLMDVGSIKVLENQ